MAKKPYHYQEQLIDLANETLFEAGWDKSIDAHRKFLDSMSEQLEASLVEDGIPWEPWMPCPGPQTLLFQTPAFITGYGGAAGGGKTGGLLALCNQHRNTLIVRRSYTRLKDIIRLSFTQYQKVASYNSQEKLWRNIPGGREIEFGYCALDKDVENYRGRQHDLKAFDEVSELKRKWFLFIIGWTRTTVPNQRTRVVCTFNPPVHPEQLWIKQFFAPWIDPEYKGVKAIPGELRYFVVRGNEDDSYDVEIPNDRIKLYIKVDGKRYRVNSPQPVKVRDRIFYPQAEDIPFDGEPLTPVSRTFIPALLEDNPFLRDSGYDSVFSSMPEIWRKVLLMGDFSINFIKDNPFQVIPSGWVDAAFKRWDEKPPENARLTRVGCDPSRGGEDATVIGSIFGNWVSPFKVIPGENLKDQYNQIPGRMVADAIVAYLLELPIENWDDSSGGMQTPIYIDSISVGASPLDMLRLMGYTDTVGFDVRTAAVDNRGNPRTDKSGNIFFSNIRSFSWWMIREALDPSNPNAIALPPDQTLKEELICPHYKLLPIKSDEPTQTTPKFQVQVESKDELHKRLGRSTNHADVLAMLVTKYSPRFSWSDLNY